MHKTNTRVCKNAILFFIFCNPLFYIACARISGAPSGASAVPYEKNVEVDLSSTTDIGPRARFRIANHGTDSVVMPAIVPEGTSALNRPSILYPLRALKDEQLALATWQFVVSRSQHFCAAGAPGDPGGLAVDPERLLNGFGAMCCDQASRVLIWLWQGAGYPSRLVATYFHAVPEIFYAGAWHMFDSDHRVYYLKLDGKTVASVADIIANPYLVARVADANGNDPSGYPAQLMADQYATATAAYTLLDYTRDETDKTYLLHPDESFRINYGTIVPVFHGTLAEPSLPPATTGRFDWILDYSKPYWASLPQAVDGVTTITDSSLTFLTNSNPGTGFVVYAHSSPFPLMDLRLSGVVNRANPTAAVNAFFSTDGHSWSRAFPLVPSSGNPNEASADLSSVAAGQYVYFLMVQISGNSPSAARIANLHITSDFQASPFVFPNLIPGQVNHLIYQDWSSTGTSQNVKVSLRGE